MAGNPWHDSRGRFASGNSAAGNEAGHRDAQRYPVAPARGQGHSVGTHNGGHVVSALNERTGNFEIVSSGKRTSVSESIARGLRADKKHTKIF
jgi:hypothetical protein